MNFANLQVSGKGTTRKSTLGATRESSFDIRYSHYTKKTKAGDVVVSQFNFSQSAMTKTDLESKQLAANIVNDAVTGFVGIAVTANGELFKATKRSAEGKKAKSVCAPNLVKFLSDAGKLFTEFEGGQYFDLVDRGEVEGIGHVFEILPSETNAFKPYVAGDEDSEGEAESTNVETVTAEEVE
jgi:hypothetical protein